MDFRSRLPLVAAVLIALTLAACGDDSPTGGTTDTTPPGVSSVTPVDAFHIDVTFSEQVAKASAETEGNYSIVETASPVSRKANTAPGDPVAVAGATLKNDNKTVTLATETSMSGLNLDLVVHNVSDMSGNKIGEGGSEKPFTGSDTPDGTAPTVVSYTPLSNATNITVNATVVVNFSESIESATASWTVAVGLNAGNLRTGGGVSYTPTIDGAKLTLTPNAPLAYSTTYALNVAGTDNAGNAGTNTSWTFTTGANNDHTPPTLVSTSPANLATYVNVDANLSMTFSEPVSQGVFSVELVPDPGAGTRTWSNGGKTMTFDPTASLLTNQSYTLTIFPNGVYDLAGNGIVGFHTVTFTTAQYLASGSIAGTISGDAGTPAADPTGAAVIASDSSPFDGGSFNVFGSTKVAGNDTYSIPYLPDGEYYIVSAIDTNHDGDIDPSTGDAVGGYGVNVATADLSPDSIVVAGGAHVTGKNFALFDPSTASGTVAYTGAAKGDYPIFVGLFDTTGFSTTDEPVTGTNAYDFDHKWNVNSLEQVFPEDDYYVGAYMDLNLNDTYDPLTDPAGFYGGLPAPTAVHIANGNDVTGINIPISDPTPGLVAPASVIWPKATRNAAFQRMVEIVRQGQLQASR